MTTRTASSGSNSNGLHGWIGNPSLQKLSTLLRNEGHRVLNGTSAFTLTTEVLAQLNTDCRRHSLTENDTVTAELAAVSRNILPLTSRLRVQQEANKSKAEWSSHIQFIKDFMLSTPSLKLICSSGTLSAPISLHRFGNLTCLNLRKVPIHMVEGMQKLRGTLTSITVYRSVDKVKDLLEFCGGDMSAPMTWPQLKFVSFTFNSISLLDDSLRLLPHAEVLDLSHNSLDTCDRFLEYLGDVKRVTLAYNFLTSIPSVSLTTRVSLICLVLRGNSLDNMKGLEELTSLQELDFGENCLSDHSFLGPLGHLIKLKQLQLDGNPVFYHRLHRPLTAKCLAVQVFAAEFELDRKKLTASEISYFSSSKMRYKDSATRYLPSQSSVGVSSSTPDSDYGLSPSSGIGTENESLESAASIKRKNKRRRRKARHTEIQDLENSGNHSSSHDISPGTSPHMHSLEQQWRARREDALKTQKEIEELRKHYGPNWLQAIEDRDIFNKRKATPAPSSPWSSDAEAVNRRSESHMSAEFTAEFKSSSDSDAGHGTDRKSARGGISESDSQLRKDEFQTDGDLDLLDARANDMNNPIMAAIAKLASGESADDSDVTMLKLPEFEASLSGTLVNEERKFQKSAIATDGTSEIGRKTSIKSATLGLVSNVEESIDARVMVNGSQVLSEDLKPMPSSVSDSQPRLQVPAKKNVTFLTKQTEDLPAFKSQDGSSSPSEKPSSDLKSSLNTHRRLQKEKPDSTSSTFISEEEKVAESVFASLPLQNNEMIILTLTDTFLLEKDVRGKVTERLELAGLISVKCENIKKMIHDAVEQSGKVLDNSGERLDSDRVAVSEEKKSEKGKDKTDEDVESMQLDLKFDYMRKDRQSRRYVMEHADGQIILAHLQPFLDSREDKERAKSSVVMQCLKCNKKFLKSELVEHRQQLPTSGSNKDLQSLQDTAGKPALMCPKCGSSLVIELESTPTAGIRTSGSASSTPAGSYTPSSGSYISQAKKTTPLLKRRSFDVSRDIQSRLPAVPTGRERSSAFRAPSGMSSSLITSGEVRTSEGDELMYVEDHFSAETMTSVQTTAQLAEMTTSLRGDSSTRGRMAHVDRPSLRDLQSDVGQNEPRTVDVKQRHLMSSGYENGVTSCVDNSSKPIAIGWKVKVSENQGTGGKEETEENKLKASGRSSVHKNLATMEDIVNSLVSEGRCLEEQEQESSVAGSYSSLKSKSVSVATFMRSSHGQNRRTSVASVGSSDAIRHSESSSSIAVLPVPAPSINPESQSTPATVSSSVPVTFTVGSFGGSDSLAETSEKGSTNIVSPLSSSICSSMVSSVYETSVNNSEQENGGLVRNDSNAHTVPGGASNADGSTDLVVIGSSSSGSSEDLTSIYDRPREPRSSSAKKAGAKVKSASVVSIDPSKSSPSHEESAVTAFDGQPGSRATTPLQAGGPSYTHAVEDMLAVPDEADDEDDESDDQSVVPQYAFHHLNHRLMLYMMMSLFGSDEEFVCKIQSQVVQYIIEKPYEGVLVMSSTRFYILKITSEDHSKPPDQWLHCVEIQPVPELRYIDVGLGGQSLRLEFVTDCSSYTFITRNRDKTLQFVEILHTNLAKYAVSQGIASHVVVNEDIDQVTVDNLEHDVVSKVKSDQRLLHYCMGFIERGNQKLFPVSFVITSCDICLVRTNHQWPQPRLQAPITEETVGKQFTVLERQKISNIASVEVCEATMKKIRLELFNETEGVSANWNVTLATRQSTVDFINALSEPWGKEFGVEMDVVYAELTF